VKRDAYKQRNNPALQFLQDISRERRKGSYSHFGWKD